MNDYDEVEFDIVLDRLLDCGMRGFDWYDFNVGKQPSFNTERVFEKTLKKLMKKKGYTCVRTSERFPPLYVFAEKIAKDKAKTFELPASPTYT